MSPGENPVYILMVKSMAAHVFRVASEPIQTNCSRALWNDNCSCNVRTPIKEERKGAIGECELPNTARRNSRDSQNSLKEALDSKLLPFGGAIPFSEWSIRSTGENSVLICIAQDPQNSIFPLSRCIRLIGILVMSGSKCVCPKGVCVLSKFFPLGEKQFRPWCPPRCPT